MNDLEYNIQRLHAFYDALDGDQLREYLPEKSPKPRKNFDNVKAHQKKMVAKRHKRNKNKKTHR